jgi:hypothetical protein
MCYDWCWITNCSLGSTENDGAFVAVVDGGKNKNINFSGIIISYLLNRFLL